MLLWIIIVISVISNAFFLGFRYARRIENKLEVPLSGKEHLYCLGDGITYGVGVLSNRRAFAWPYQLEVSLGAKWQVINYGTEDATLLNSRNNLKSGRAFQVLSQMDHPRVLLMIGTNDSKLGTWHELRFESEFASFLSQLRGFCSDLIVLLPVFVHPSHTSGKRDVRADIVKCIVQTEAEICQDMNVPFIDLFHLSEMHPEWYCNDGIHLNRQGNRALADAVFAGIQSLYRQTMEDTVI